MNTHGRSVVAICRRCSDMGRTLLAILPVLIFTSPVSAALFLDQQVLSGPAAGSITFSTTQPNDVVLLLVGAETDGNAGTIDISSSCGLTWSVRTSQLTGANGGIATLYWAPAPSIVSGCTVTATFSGSRICNRSYTEWSVGGAYDINHPFDPYPAFPQTISEPSNGPPIMVNTVSSNSFIYTIGFGSAGSM